MRSRNTPYTEKATGSFRNVRRQFFYLNSELTNGEIIEALSSVRPLGSGCIGLGKIVNRTEF